MLTTPVHPLSDTHTHARTHTRTHTHTNTRIYTRTHTHPHTHRHIYPISLFLPSTSPQPLALQPLNAAPLLPAVRHRSLADSARGFKQRAQPKHGLNTARAASTPTRTHTQHNGRWRTGQWRHVLARGRRHLHLQPHCRRYVCCCAIPSLLSNPPATGAGSVLVSFSILLYASPSAALLQSHASPPPHLSSAGALAMPSAFGESGFVAGA